MLPLPSSPRYSFFIGSQFSYWGSLGVSLAWICLLAIASKMPAWRGAVQLLATTGRMAFTNYILESLLCTLIFYGHGFGLFSKVSRVQEVLVMVAVWMCGAGILPVVDAALLFRAAGVGLAFTHLPGNRAVRPVFRSMTLPARGPPQVIPIPDDDR